MAFLFCLAMIFSTLALLVPVFIVLYLAADFLILGWGMLGTACFFALITAFVIFILIPWVCWWDTKYKKLKAKKK